MTDFVLHIFFSFVSMVEMCNEMCNVGDCVLRAHIPVNGPLWPGMQGAREPSSTIDFCPRHHPLLL